LLLLTNQTKLTLSETLTLTVMLTSQTKLTLTVTLTVTDTVTVIFLRAFRLHPQKGCIALMKGIFHGSV